MPMHGTPGLWMIEVIQFLTLKLAYSSILFVQCVCFIMCLCAAVWRYT